MNFIIQNSYVRVGFCDFILKLFKNRIPKNESLVKSNKILPVLTIFFMGITTKKVNSIWPNILYEIFGHYRHNQIYT